MRELSDIPGPAAGPGPCTPAGEGRSQRPWGWFETLGEGSGYRVKRLFLNPGQRLSLQRHSHRSEHWVVVSGRGRLTCDDALLPAEPGISLFIPTSAIHRAEAEADSPGLEIIEVQRGDWLSEDDIERFADDYGRSDERRQPPC